MPGTSPARARRVRRRLRAVLEWAVAMESRIDNPCDRLSSACADERHYAVVCGSGFGPPETINRVDHNCTLTITVPVGLDELAGPARQRR